MTHGAQNNRKAKIALLQGLSAGRIPLESLREPEKDATEFVVVMADTIAPGADTAGIDFIVVDTREAAMRDYAPTFRPTR